MTPSEFWKQSPRTLSAILSGCAKREERAIERDVVLAWRVANFSRAQKLKSLDKYLTEMKPVKPQTADDVAGIFLHFKALGKAKIRERKRLNS